MVIGMSIEPKERDREEATRQVLIGMLAETDPESIADILIRQQQVIMQAERLKEIAMRLVEERDHPRERSIPESLQEKSRG